MGDRAFVRDQVVKLVLGEEADLQAGCRLQLSALGLQSPGDELGEGRLAIAVLTEQGDAVVVVNAQVQVF
jgi:hypothetical protein